ncbi:hypothetical protein IM660_01845 [Ruania alkalisoli]|uniref:LPXTG cell wall anchor domain-containing protein n=1 Tax=Ruania alkalisoli TaxID=2779775 RepID=A0A7M1T0W8_9MICO|nr:hypothetical protein IM660_01845 [Ruania alkalisoli]
MNGETYPLTTAGAGSDTGLDSNPDQNTGRYSFTTPATGENSGEPGQADMPTIDAGYTPPEPQMPVTGTDGALTLVGLAAGLVLAGMVLAMLRRRTPA